MKKLAVYGESNGYYTLVVWDLEEDELYLGKMSKSLEELPSENDWVIAFENNDTGFVKEILNKVNIDNVLKVQNMWGRSIYGWCHTKQVKDYGYNYNLAEGWLQVLNGLQYLLMKNKGL